MAGALNRDSRRVGAQNVEASVDSGALPPAPNRLRARIIGLILGALGITLTVSGVYLFKRSEARWSNDPGHSSRTPEVLDQMLLRGEAAERAGDRGAAIAAYLFVLAVGSNGDPDEMV
jgi:hypothetical protein